MSQRDPESRPLSRVSSPSSRSIPLTSAAASTSASLPAIVDFRGDYSFKPVRDITEPSRSLHGGDGASSVPHARGFHSILNPLNVQAQGDAPPVASQHPGSSSGKRAADLTSPQGAIAPSHLVQQQSYSPHPFAQVGNNPSSRSPQTEIGLPGPPGGGRGSPKSAAPLPALNNPRAFASPKMPRVHSLHNPPVHKLGERMDQRVISSTAGVKRPYEESLPSTTSSSLPRPSLSYAPPSTPVSSVLPSAAPLSLPSGGLRSASQPILAEHRTPTVQHSALPQPYPSDAPRASLAQQHQPPAALTAGPPQTHSSSSSPWDSRASLGQPPVFGSGQTQEQETGPWSASGAASHGASRSRARARSERSEPPSSYLEMNPPGGERYLVEINTQIASKQADEKRQRNAGASARFRQRRKQQALEDKNKIMQLEEEKRALEARLQESMHHRDFYKNERNRLRDIVLRTPGISESALTGPRSPPTSNFSLGGFPDQAQMSRAGPPPNITTSHGYASSETSSIERPTRRRRTDQTPDTGAMTATYAHQPPQGHGLPPIAAPSYGLPPSRPPSASSTGETLPPIRGLEGGPPHETGAHAGPPGPYYPGHRAAYESGWAHRQGGPSEGNQR